MPAWPRSLATGQPITQEFRCRSLEHARTEHSLASVLAAVSRSRPGRGARRVSRGRRRRRTVWLRASTIGPCMGAKANAWAWLVAGEVIAVRCIGVPCRLPDIHQVRGTAALGTGQHRILYFFRADVAVVSAVRRLSGNCCRTGVYVSVSCTGILSCFQPADDRSGGPRLATRSCVPGLNVAGQRRVRHGSSQTRVRQ